MFEGHPYSLIPIEVEAFNDQDSICKGTGFLYAEGDSFYFVSNWHIFAGYDQFAKQYSHPDRLSPNRLRLTIRKPSFPDTSIADLYIFDLNGPTWLQHPRGPEIDVACVKFPSGDPAMSYTMANGPNNSSLIPLRVGDEMAVLGFPDLGGSAERLPIWKFGRIASEPHYPINALPCFLIDSTASMGMSGAPVFSIRADDEKGELGSFSGIYFSQAQSSINYLGLGVVLKASVIGETILGKQPGRLPRNP